jgi:hypothetical protein
MLYETNISFFKLGTPFAVLYKKPIKLYKAQISRISKLIIKKPENSKISTVSATNKLYVKITRPYEFKKNLAEVIMINGGGYITDFWHGTRLLENVLKTILKV